MRGDGCARARGERTAPRKSSGTYAAGNTRHTRNIRCVRAADGSGSSGVYSEEEFLEDLMQVTESPPNMDLARRTIRESRALPRWMSEHGVSWQEPLAGTLNLGRTNRWFLGGGKALANAYYQKAIEMGVHVCYDAFVEDLVIEGGNFQAALSMWHRSQGQSQHGR